MCFITFITPTHNHEWEQKWENKALYIMNEMTSDTQFNIPDFRFKLQLDDKT